MPYVDLAGLSRFAGKSKDFASSACAGLDMANWQKTAAAGAVSFSPVPEMPLDPVVNFLFSETGPASGTKGPDNPSIITGVSSVKVTRCGKNLFKRPYSTASGSTIYTTTFSVDNETGTVTANTPTSSPNNASFWLEGGTSSVRLVGGKTYYLSGCPAGGSANTYRLGLTIYSLKHEATGPTFYEYGDGCVITPSVDCYFVATATVRAGATVSNLVFKPMLEEASAATSFEPYEGADYTIDLNGTYYGGSVDLSAGVMTVTYRMVELSPSNYFVNAPTQEMVSGIWQKQCLQLNVDGLRCNVFDYNPSAGFNEDNYFCNAYDWDRTGTSVSYHFSRNGFYICVSASSGEECESIVSNLISTKYSAGTPIICGYPLENPYTVQLTPTQIYSLSQSDPYAPRINTVYSDQTSIQVGYPKSPQATQNELANAIVSLGGNV